jgi:hypothetical protein
MRDLDTLGGPDAIGDSGCRGNEHKGLVAGSSYTNSTPNPSTGIPTMDPFLSRRLTRQTQCAKTLCLSLPSGKEGRPEHCPQRPSGMESSGVHLVLRGITTTDKSSA